MSDTERLVRRMRGEDMDKEKEKAAETLEGTETVAEEAEGHREMREEHEMRELQERAAFDARLDAMAEAAAATNAKLDALVALLSDGAAMQAAIDIDNGDVDAADVPELEDMDFDL